MPILHWSDCQHTRNAKTVVPFRLLKAIKSLSYGDKNHENLLIQGDNLHALKALLPYYRGQVKCIFIDPPYNTKSAFEHYADSMEHSQWLNMMFPRLQLLRDLLSEDGSIWVTMDDNEAHYLKVVMDEIFGRGNFITSIVWNHRKSVQNDIIISLSHNHVLIYAKNLKAVALNRLAVEESKYDNPDNDPRGAWSATPFDAPNIRPNLTYAIRNPNTGEEYWPPNGRHWRTSEAEYLRLLANNEIVFGKTGKSKPQQKRFLRDAEQKGSTVKTWWDDVGTATEATKELQKVSVDFDTPKPERLLQRILEIATNPGDLVLDSFLGSGTTAAVAHKMQRRYIGIEMGEHAKTHCAVRLGKVVDGEQGGISQAVNWQGGGGFGFYQLGAELFTPEGTIHPDVRFIELAAYLWFYETHTTWHKPATPSPLLGVHNNIAYYLLYNGILKDVSEHGGNILTEALLKKLPEHSDKKVIYALESYLDTFYLNQKNIQFHPIPQAVPTESRIS